METETRLNRWGGGPTPGGRPCAGAPRPGRRRGAAPGPTRRTRASGVMSVMPPPPWIWIARSITVARHPRHGHLDRRDLGGRALGPALSISHAVLSTSSRACSTSIRDCAICSRTTPCSASGRSNATRDCARRTIRSIARSAIPISRMQWWIRPGPEPRLGDREPAALLAEQVADGHAHVGERELGVPVLVLVAERPEVPDDRQPGVSRGTSTIDCCRCGPALRVGLAHHDEDLAALVGGAGDPPLAAVDDVVVAVAHDAGLDVGGVRRRDVRLGHRERRTDLARQQRLEPLLLLLRVPNRCSVSMLPVSGAWQLIASGAMSGDQPVTSATAAYSRLDSPEIDGQEQVPQPAAPAPRPSAPRRRAAAPTPTACPAGRPGTPRRRPRQGGSGRRGRRACAWCSHRPRRWVRSPRIALNHNRPPNWSNSQSRN